MEWKPATIEEVIQILKSDLVKCNSEQTVAFENYHIEPYLAPISRFGSLEYVVVVAKKGDQVIYWEDVEEGFGISPIDNNGMVLQQDSNQNSLGLALNEWIKQE